MSRSSSAASPRAARLERRARRASRILAAAAAALVLATTPSLLAGPAEAVGTAPAATAPSGSAVTVKADGDFAGLEVTVSQTADLVNQVIRIDWKGGAPTRPDTDSFALNYLQIMQCWGDAQEGPRREQCQYGAANDGRGGQNTASRQLTLPRTVVDPDETEYPAPAGQPNVYVPFDAANSERTTGSDSKFFDASTTNEIPYARTRADGTGFEFFEVQTGLEAPGLGCGQVSSSAPDGRACWLVVVPRSDREVDGTVRGSSASDGLISSPLSSANWKHRLVVPLRFQPIGDSCPIGRPEQGTLGSELVSEAMSRWQPALCESGSTNYSYAVIGDSAARRKLVEPSPGLVFVQRALPADQAVPGAEPVYAPVSVSGIAIAFNVDRQSPVDAAPEIKARDGQRVTDIRLNQRLVAKLLTQSYRYDASGPGQVPDSNPFDLSRDPEFRSLNPEFEELEIPALGRIVLPLGLSDATHQVWEYVLSDKAAKAFLAGKPDTWGMVVNPLYKQVDLPREDYPKADLQCRDIPGASLPLCTLDAQAYSNDYFSSARALSRGETFNRSTFDPNAQPPAWKRNPAQPSGKRALLAIVDTASAARFNLTVASLRNAAGEYVAPSVKALSTAARTVDASAGPAQPDAASKASGAYPLTAIAYAATVPSSITRADGRNYAALLDYVADDGQVPGTGKGELPAGYAPLPAALRGETATAARTVRTESGPTPTPTPTPTVTDDGSGGGGIPGGGEPVGEPTTDPSAAPTASPEPSASPTATPGTRPVAATAPTPADPVPSSRYALVVALVLGAAALLLRSVAPWAAHRLGR